MKRKLHIVIIVTLSLVWLILFADVGVALAANDWFVRPAGGNYGKEDGSSYQDAWDGLKNVVWGPSGVEAGDTLYVCGLHVYDMTALGTGLVDQADITPVSGTSESARVVIRGDYPGDQGIIWSAYKPTYRGNWVDETGYYSLDVIGNHQSDWFFEDVTADSWVVLDRQTNVQDVKDNAGSFYWDKTNTKLYVHCTDSGDPTGRILINSYGYDWKLNGLEYITFLNLKFYAPDYFFWDGESGSHIRWEGCTLSYGRHSFITLFDNCDYIEVVDCELSWASNGIYTISGSNNAPSNYLFKGNYIHDIGVRESTQNSDAHCIGIQGGHDGVIEDNIFENCGSGPLLYAFTNQELKNITVRRNLIKDTHNLGGATGYGIGTQCNNDASADKSGNKFYQNIVINASVGGRFHFEQEQEVYNNIFYNCNVGFASGRNYNGLGANVKLRNNIFLNSTSYHISWYSGASDYTINFDYNLFYPIEGDLFRRAKIEMNFAEWQALSKTNCTFDPNSIIADPLFVDPENTNFGLQAGSPAIDAGIDVGLTHDVEGNPIINAPDIGAYEYIIPTGNLPPDISAIPDTLNKTEGETINTPEIELAQDPDGDPLTYTYSGWLTSLPYTITNADIGTHTLHVDVSDGTDTVGKDITVTVALAASEWFVRPAGGNYGSEDGSSYQDAWDGLSNVVWGTGGVEAGDTLYICGLHLRTRTGGSAWEIFTPGASGTGEDSRIIIRGDYPGDQGIIWGAGIMAHEPWVDEGNNTWSITDVGTPNSMWYFEDITAGSWTVLDRVDSLEECKATPGSYYSPDYTIGSKFYVHTSDNGNPTDRIAANRLGYHMSVNDIHYITWLNLKFYAIYRWIDYGSAPYGFVTHMRWENCTIWYGEFIHFLFRNHNHHNEFINCNIGWAKNGIGFAEYPIGSGSTGDGSEPHDFIIRGCKFHHIGIPYGTSDSHAIAGQGSRNIIIEKNEMYLIGTGVTFYCYNTNQAIKNITIRWNWIHDTHSDWGANSRGIELNTGPGQAPGTSAVVYGNIVGPNVSDVGYRYLWTELGEFYNNVAYDCGTSFYFHHHLFPVNVRLRNSISVNPKNHHIRFSNNDNSAVTSLNSDYNIFYPVTEDNFFIYVPEAMLTDVNFSEWQALSIPGSTFDTHSIAADPLFVDPENGNFHLRPNSPAIDAGVDVGLIRDFEGIPVPQGNAPDIGAYEYVLLPVSVIRNEPKEGRVPLTVSFDGSQSTSPHGDIVSYEWDFGDGSTSTGIKTSHIFTSPGEYTVTLTVTDDLGLKGKSQTHIIVFEKEFGELPAGCYNNVFNPAKGERALIVVELPKQSHVRLNLYNTRGNRIRELADEQKEAGTHKYYWDGKSGNGDVVGSGLYFVHIQAGDYKKTKKIAVIK